MGVVGKVSPIMVTFYHATFTWDPGFSWGMMGVVETFSCFICSSWNDVFLHAFTIQIYMGSRFLHME